MHYLIIGYGYCGYYLAKSLLKHGEKVSAIARTYPSAFQLDGLDFIEHDISTHPLQWPDKESIIYYLVPPPHDGTKDQLLRDFLEKSLIKPKTIVYFGSSGVYGNHHGQKVTESSPCHITQPRQLRRLDAEQCVITYCNRHQSKAIILRIAGIYGPMRLPIEAAQAQSPTLNLSEAPLINYIAVTDLAEIAMLLAATQTAQGIFNVSDGQARPLASLQIKIAEKLNLPKAQEQSFKDAFHNASEMKKEFLSASKDLDITRLLNTIGQTFTPSSLDEHLTGYLDQKELR